MVKRYSLCQHVIQILVDVQPLKEPSSDSPVAAMDYLYLRFAL